MLQQQHLGEQGLPRRRALFQLPHRLVPDLEQLLAGQSVLVLLDALQQELVVLLLERARRPARRTGLVLARQAQHGSTCTVTSCSRRSRLRRSSTWSAIAWADSTSAWRSTHTVTSAYRRSEGPRDRMLKALFTPGTACAASWMSRVGMARSSTSTGTVRARMRYATRTITSATPIATAESAHHHP